MPSQRLKAYIEADRLEKENKKIKDSSRAFIDRLLKRAKSMGVYLRGISYQERQTVKFDDNELHSWIKKQYMSPILDGKGELQFDNNGEIVATLDFDKWQSLTKEVIDEEKLEQAIERGEIDLSNLPETCYIRGVSKVVTIDHKRINYES